MSNTFDPDTDHAKVVHLRSRERAKIPATYQDAITQQRGGVPEWGDENQCEWLMALVSKQLNLSKAAIRCGVLINAVEFKLNRFDWATIKFALDGLGYNDAQLYAAIEELKRVGLMSPAPTNSTATAQ